MKMEAEEAFRLRSRVLVGLAVVAAAGTTASLYVLKNVKAPGDVICLFNPSASFCF